MYDVPLLDSIAQEVQDYFVKYNLNGWTFEFDEAAKRYGWCDSNKKRISLSVILCVLNPRAETTQTILHEIAHAIAGCEHQHNLFWLQTARKIGYTGSRCYKNNVLTPAALALKGR